MKTADSRIDRSARNKVADEAYEREMAPARLPLKDPKRESYPVVVKRALAAYDEVVRRWGS